MTDDTLDPQAPAGVPDGPDPVAGGSPPVHFTEAIERLALSHTNFQAAQRETLEAQAFAEEVCRGLNLPSGEIEITLASGRKRGVLIRRGQVPEVVLL